MVRAIGQIEQDLAALEETFTTVAQQVQSAYAEYLRLLGEAVQRQLILAAYQVCTQTYPEAFLQLSFSQRQQLQQALQKLARQAQAQLLNSASAAPNLDQESQDEQEQPQLTQTQADGKDSEAGSFQAEESSSRQEEAPSESGDAAGETSQPQQQLARLLTWYQQQEQAIAQTLTVVSEQSNLLLQKAGILPQGLPAKMLEAAVQSEESRSATSGTPNLLNLLLETDSKESTPDSAVAQLTVIRLRQAELEFTEPTLNSQRSQIRNLAKKLQTLRQQYQSLLREQAVAQAESAWRSSWMEN